MITITLSIPTQETWASLRKVLPEGVRILAEEDDLLLAAEEPHLPYALSTLSLAECWNDPADDHWDLLTATVTE